MKTLDPARGVPLTASCAACLMASMCNAFGSRRNAFVGDDHARSFAVRRQEQLEPALEFRVGERLWREVERVIGLRRVVRLAQGSRVLQCRRSLVVDTRGGRVIGQCQVAVSLLT